MSIYTFNLPDIGEGIAEAEIVAWHVKVGDRVEEDDQIADMMTDKATVEMEAPVSGTVVAVAGEEGDIIAIGAMLVQIEADVDEEAAESDEAESPAAPTNSDHDVAKSVQDTDNKEIIQEEPIAPVYAPKAAEVALKLPESDVMVADNAPSTKVLATPLCASVRPIWALISAGSKPRVSI